MKPQVSSIRRIVRKRLKKMSGLEHAFLYGSGPTVNLLLVGELVPDDVTRAVKDLEQFTGWQVNYVASSGCDIRERILKGDPFIGAVIRNDLRIYGDGKEISTWVKPRRIFEPGSPTRAGQITMSPQSGIGIPAETDSKNCSSRSLHGQGSNAT